MALIIVPSTVDGYIDSNHVPYPKAPAEADYWGKTYNDFKDWDAYDAARDEWLKSEGYKEYSKAMDAYHESEAYKAAQQHNMDLYNLRGNVSAVTGFASFALYLVYLVLIFFVERYKYLEALSNRSGAGAAREVTQTLKEKEKILQVGQVELQELHLMARLPLQEQKRLYFMRTGKSPMWYLIQYLLS